MESSNCLIIESIDKLHALDGLRKTFNKNSLGFEGELRFGKLHGEFIHLTSNSFAILMKIMSKLRVKQLTLYSVTPTADLNYKGLKCHNLNLVSMSNCRQIMVLISFLLEFCPNLQSLSDVESTVEDVRLLESWGRGNTMSRRINIILREFERNSHLIKFESSSIEDELLQLTRWDIPGGRDRSKFQKFMNDLVKLIDRNNRGYRKCRLAVYQLFLIKKFRSDSIFSVINRDCVMLIAKLLYKTIGTKIWCE